MRTKALILSAIVCAGGLVSAVAQNVYSVNVVGYTTVTVTNAYVLLANQLDDGAGNAVTNHIPTATQGTQVFKYNPLTGGYATLTRLPTSWSGATTMTMAPGEGVFFKKATSVGSQTLTFVGEVMQGELHNPVTLGYDIYSAMVPQVGGISTVHGYPAQQGDQVFRFLPASGGYQTFTRGPTTWLGAGEPVLQVNEAVWIKAAAAKDWVRTFTVN